MRDYLALRISSSLLIEVSHKSQWLQDAGSVALALTISSGVPYLVYHIQMLLLCAMESDKLLNDDASRLTTVDRIVSVII